MCQCWSRGRVSRRTPSVPLAPKRSCARPSSHLPPLGAQLGRGAQVGRVRHAALVGAGARAGLRQGARGAAERRGRAGGDRLRRRLQVRGALATAAWRRLVRKTPGQAAAGTPVHGAQRSRHRAGSRARPLVRDPLAGWPWPPWPPWPPLEKTLKKNIGAGCPLVNTHPP